MTTTEKFTRALARTTSIIVFKDTEGNEQGGVVGGTLQDTFSVVSHPRYGDTESRKFRYEDVAEILEITPRDPVLLPLFVRLMNGGRA